MREPTVTAAELFGQALELPPGKARREFLASRCPGSELRLELESLLSAHEEAGNFLGPSAEADGSSVNDGLRPALSSQRPESAGVRPSASPVQPAAREELPLPRIAGYRIEHVLGEGSLGIVYRAIDEKLNRPVALKVLRPEASEAVRRRVLQEARQAAALNHPAVVTIFAVLDEANPPAIVMELVDGFPLDRFAAQLNFRQKARLLREVARGLAAAHARGLVHRDLKPGNVVVGPDMRPRILDFGLALSVEEAGQPGGNFEGTPLFASPEQVRGEPLTAASDVFSFGSLMFSVLTGRPPFLGETVADVLKAVATHPPPMPSEVAMSIPEDLQAICLSCLGADPVDRPTAADVSLELGRFLMGEPVRLRPKLYHDLLRRSISEHSSQARTWASQSMISSEERDALEILHRRLLAGEDHWIIDARRITPMQTALASGTWLAVVATLLTVWMLRDEMGLPWRWLLPTCFTFVLLGAGYAAHRAREALASATFLAGAVLAIAPCTLVLLGEIGPWGTPPPGVAQLLEGTFTNAQVLAASTTALLVSAFSWWRLKMTAFAWTTATLAAATYLSVLLLWNWLEQKPEIQALWFLPLASFEAVALVLERNGRVRWTLPFHLVALLALVGCLNAIAWHGPTLEMLGVGAWGWTYFNADRLQALSFAANGLLFFLLMLLSQRAASLDLRRAGRLLEILAILHTLAPLFLNALNHRDQPYLRLDVGIYLGAAVLFVMVAPFRSRWRILVGGLAGFGLGSYLLVDLGLVARKPFIIGLGLFGIVLALSTYAYARRLQQQSWPLAGDDN